MCGRFNLTESPLVQALLIELGLEDLVDVERMRFNDDCAPLNPISIVTHQGIEDAIWHLYLIPENGKWKPKPKNWSINSRADKLHRRPEYRTQRCLIPATGFVESQSGKYPHQLEFPGKGFFFGGLYKRYEDAEAGPITSTTIITLPGHHKLEHIHRKAFPLIMPTDSKVISKWLDPEFGNTHAFEDLLTPNIRWNMTATPIDKASTKVKIGEVEQFTPDWLI